MLIRTSGLALAVAVVLSQFEPPSARAQSTSGTHAQPRFVAVPGEQEFSGQLIVRPARGLAPDRAAAARQRLNGIVARYYPETDEYIVNVVAARGADAPAGSAENALADELLATGLFQYAHPNWICYPNAVPNDPQYSSQWHLPQIHCPEAWNITTGSTSIISAVTDTGVDINHPDLIAHRVPGYNSASRVAEINGGDVSDINGHGTHVSGCAAAVGNNAVGVSGPGWNTSLMMVRVTNSSGGGASLDDILFGARWAIDNGAKIASSSYTGVSNAAVATTGTYIKTHGGLYCYAAGNSATNWSTFDYADVIIVGASDEGDNRAGFSGYGLAVDVFAPGTNIYATYNGQGYGPLSGTSMATPVTNGVLALIWSINPSFTPDQVESFLFQGCDDLGTPGNDDTFGWGRINAFKSVLAAAATLGPQPPIANNDAAAAIKNTARLIDVLANDVDVNGDVVSISAFDGTSAQGGTITRSVGTGPGGRDQLLFTPAANFSGTDSFGYTVADPGLLTDTASVAVTVYDDSIFRTPENPLHTGAGVTASYYAISGLSNLPDFSLFTPYASEVVANINYDSTGGNFAGSGLADNVAATLVGYVTVPQTDFYTFFTSSDDGSRLLIGTTPLVNNDGLHGMVEASGAIALKAGTHELRVEFFEAGGGAGLIVSYSGGGLLKQVIPAAKLVHAVCASDFNGDGFVTGDDFDGYVNAFEAGTPAADFNGDGFVTGDDFDEYVAAFEAGC